MSIKRAICVFNRRLIDAEGVLLAGKPAAEVGERHGHGLGNDRLPGRTVRPAAHRPPSHNPRLGVIDKEPPVVRARVERSWGFHGRDHKAVQGGTRCHRAAPGVVRHGGRVRTRQPPSCRLDGHSTADAASCQRRAWGGSAIRLRLPLGRVSQVEMATPIDLLYKVLFPSLSTFETPPENDRRYRVWLLLGVYQLLTGIREDNRGIAPTRLSHLAQYTRFSMLLREP